MRTTSLRNLFLAAALIVTTAAAVHAQEPTLEIGTSLLSATIGLGDNKGSALGIPSGGFGIINPGLYVSIFAGQYFAVEPQVGLLWVSNGNTSDHILNFGGQFDVFFSGHRSRSVYAFGAAGVIDTSGSGTSPKWAGGGLGYRVPVGDRLVFRVDGRVTHYTDNGGNNLMFALSIGGLFGER